MLGVMGESGTQRVDVGDDFVVFAAFEDVAGGTGLDAAEHVRLVAEHADDHDVAGRVAACAHADDFQPRAIGQAQVGQQHIGGLQGQLLQGAFTMSAQAAMRR